MKLTVNGEERRTEARTLAALWAAETTHLRAPADAEAGADEAAGAPGPAWRRGFAIALNGEVVRAARWDDTDVNEGDRVEIIRAVAGG